MSATEFKIEELGNKTYSYKDLGCSDWPLETVMPKVYTAIISAARALLVRRTRFSCCQRKKIDMSLCS